jgi:hypothetical protein
MCSRIVLGSHSNVTLKGIETHGIYHTWGTWKRHLQFKSRNWTGREIGRHKILFCACCVCYLCYLFCVLCGLCMLCMLFVLCVLCLLCILCTLYMSCVLCVLCMLCVEGYFNSLLVAKIHSVEWWDGGYIWKDWEGSGRSLIEELFRRILGRTEEIHENYQCPSVQARIRTENSPNTGLTATPTLSVLRH